MPSPLNNIIPIVARQVLPAWARLTPIQESAFGNTTYCHVVDTRSGHSFIINWVSNQVTVLSEASCISLARNLLNEALLALGRDRMAPSAQPIQPVLDYREQWALGNDYNNDYNDNIQDVVFDYE